MTLDANEFRMRDAYRQFIQGQLAQRQIKGTWDDVIVIGYFAARRRVKLAEALSGYHLIRKDRKGWDSFLKRAVPVVAFPLMANSALVAGELAAAPGLVLVSFDRRASFPMLIELAKTVIEANADRPADRAWCQQLMGDLKFTLNRRRKVPSTLTNGIPVYACDLWIMSNFLKSGTVSHPVIPCMAEPGRHGRINVMPWWIALDEPAPTLGNLGEHAGQLGIVFKKMPTSKKNVDS